MNALKLEIFDNFQFSFNEILVRHRKLISISCYFFQFSFNEILKMERS